MDTVLGHFLSIFHGWKNHASQLVFKGGTCLRKCYFPDYRFSEDLDFTAHDSAFQLSQAELEEILDDSAKKTGILFHLQNFRELRSNDQKMGYQCKIKFWGADHSRGQAPPPPNRWTTAIKVEITTHELLYFPPVDRKIHHPYSDKLSGVLQIPCYDLMEVLSEKIRALIQRSYTAPRDFYDIFTLQDRITSEKWPKIKAAFEKKLAFKALPPEGLNEIFEERPVRHVKKAWDKSLLHQLPDENLPDVDEVIEKVKGVLEKWFLGNGKSL